MTKRFKKHNYTVKYFLFLSSTGKKKKTVSKLYITFIISFYYCVLHFKLYIPSEFWNRASRPRAFDFAFGLWNEQLLTNKTSAGCNWVWDVWGAHDKEAAKNEIIGGGGDPLRWERCTWAIIILNHKVRAYVTLHYQDTRPIGHLSKCPTSHFNRQSTHWHKTLPLLRVLFRIHNKRSAVPNPNLSPLGPFKTNDLLALSRPFI